MVFSKNFLTVAYMYRIDLVFKDTREKNIEERKGYNASSMKDIKFLSFLHLMSDKSFKSFDLECKFSFLDLST